jgi:protein-S-isoprenylcysteine O-methyltransferase Ste14
VTNGLDRPTTFPWPPVIYAAAVAIAIILHWLAPLPWLRSPIDEFLFAVGWVVVVLAVIMEVSAMRTLARAKTTIMPHRASEHLVVEGPFSFTRNPLYLGNTMLMIAIGLITGIVWFLVMAAVAGFATQKLAIEPEERHLDARFGKGYRDYAKKVRRWF